MLLTEKKILEWELKIHCQSYGIVGGWVCMVVEQSPDCFKSLGESDSKLPNGAEHAKKL